MKYSIILLLITFSFSIYSDNQTVSITVAPQDYSSEYRQKEYLEIIKLFESLFDKKEAAAVRKEAADIQKEAEVLSKEAADIQKEAEALSKRLKGKSLTFSALEPKSYYILSQDHVSTIGCDKDYVNRLKKNFKNKELYFVRFHFHLTDKNNTGYDQIPEDIISKRPRLEIVKVIENQSLYNHLVVRNRKRELTVSGKIGYIDYPWIFFTRHYDGKYDPTPIPITIFIE
ncbi:hypothetical protein LEP1GSC163_0149 [Leptospira santarosai str. CBC379]|uniref:cell envelope integrity protein TolA n=1 Tax=Leptospira santarosai TaxID=28183 RepID=UPI0002976D55|nr:cell envelope integrity protein TolA [Leptospira santarosai]EKR89677.1 hypothetical protein LEP1GSC163_0149 [Leptospira santarosai str. CBC379]